jgi:Ca2+-transporting ATPase
VVTAIHTAVPGRARYKVDGLRRSHDLKRYLEEELSRDGSVHLVSANPLTGNVLVFYETGRTPSEIGEALGRLVPSKERPENGDGDQPAPVPSIAARRRKGAGTSRAQKTSPRVLKIRLGEAEEALPVSLWHLRKAEEAVSLFHSNPGTGLSVETYTENLKRFGPNLLPESMPRSAWSIVAEQFKSLPVLLLAVAAGISVFTGGLADAAVIMSVVGINAVIGYVTESKSEKTIRSLRSLVRPTALVTRDGETRQVGVEEVVPGDLLVLRPGSYVAADARLLAAQHLSVDESALTGESMPVQKITGQLAAADLPLGDRTNMVYMSTLVTGGQGVAVVVATGPFTEIGQIQILVGEARPPATPMETQLDKMSTKLALISAGVCGGVFVIGLLRGYGFLRMLKTSISLAVAAVPEGLPAVATTTLALGIRTMRKHHVLVRQLQAIETLGSVQTICLDKTGTLTVNRMTVTQVFVGMERSRVSEGRFWSATGETNPYLCEELLMLLHVSVLCSESEIISEGGVHAVTGSATENALVQLALSAGVDANALRGSYPRTNILHRSETRNLMVTVHDASEGHRRVVAVKGSPPEVLAACQYHMRGGETHLLTEEDRETIEAGNDGMAGLGLRVLGMAYAVSENGLMLVENGDVPINNLIWLGIAGMADPVRSGAKELIQAFHRAGIHTMMITGDQSATAYAVGKELDLSGNGDMRILDSTHLSDMAPDVLKAVSQDLHVFARVSPANKLQIVQMLQEQGKVVAMTGDGINDGPALKVAAIGIAMGHTGTDVAREVADIVLEDDNLETMLIAVSEGRTIYNNIRKALRYLLSTNMSEIMVTTTAISAGLGEPLTAMQLLWINLVSDIFPGLALALEPPEPDILLKAPRDPGEQILEASSLARMLRESAVLSAGSLGAYGYGVLRYGQGPQASTMAFLSLTMGQLLHALSCRSETRTIFDKEKPEPNRYLTMALLGTFALQGIALVVPGLRGLLNIAGIGAFDSLVVAGGAVLPLLANEAIKTTQRGDA